MVAVAGPLLSTGVNSRRCLSGKPCPLLNQQVCRSAQSTRHLTFAYSTVVPAPSAGYSSCKSRPFSSSMQHRQRGAALQAVDPKTGSRSSKEDDSLAPVSGDNSQLLVTIGLGALWLALVTYALVYSPNQTPARDMIFLQRLVGLGEKDGFVVNPCFTALFNIMGIYPILYSALLIPAGRSGSKVPAWPFVAASFGTGIFALLPYMALWRPLRGNTVPPPKSELEGWRRFLLKGTETTWLPASLVAGTLFLFGMAITAGPYYWSDYLKLFDESRFVHVTTVDFALLTAIIPFWIANDANLRGWNKGSGLLNTLSWLPVLGPAIYLVLRPKSGDPPPSQSSAVSEESKQQ